MEKKYLIFKIEKEHFAIDLRYAREIISYSKPTPLHSMPSYFEGLIHLRGFFLPLIDIRTLLNIPVSSSSVNTRCKTIIISIYKKIVGIKIEEVEDIISLEESKILPPPALIKTQESNYVSGGFYVDEKVVLIVDLDKLFVETILPHNTQIKEASR